MGDEQAFHSLQPILSLLQAQALSCTSTHSWHGLGIGVILYCVQADALVTCRLASPSDATHCLSTRRTNMFRSMYSYTASGGCSLNTFTWMTEYKATRFEVLNCPFLNTTLDEVDATSQEKIAFPEEPDAPSIPFFKYVCKQT